MSEAAASTVAGPSAVLTAASLTEVLPHIDPDARSSFGGSSQLAQQVRLGFPFDVFLSASPKYAEDLYREGLVRKPVVFASNSLVLIVPRKNPARIGTVADLAKRPKLRLVVAGPAVPIGLYTREVLKRLSLLRVLRKTVSLEPDVKGIVGNGITRTLPATGRTSVRYTKPASASPSATFPTMPFTSGSRLTVLRRTRSSDSRFSTSRV